MKLVISKKLHLVHGTATLDAQSVKQAVFSPSGTHQKVLDTPEEVQKYVQDQTLQGFTCHVFDYVESFRHNTSVEAFKVA